MRFLTLSPDQIRAPLVALRAGMDEEALRELVADVKEHGVRVPISIVSTPDGYRIAAGHRRWLAAQQAGLTEIPCVLKDLDEEAEVGEMLAENLHREAPNPLDEARAFAIFQEASGRSTFEVAQYIHKSPQYVANRLRILHGPEEVTAALRDQLINLSVALELLRCDHDADRKFLLAHAIGNGATAATVGRWVREQAEQRAKSAAYAGTPAEVVNLEYHEMIQTACEWHRGQVPMERSLSFRVCGDCYQELIKIRDQAFGPSPAAATPPAPAPAPSPPRWRVFYVRRMFPTNVLEEVMSAPTQEAAVRELTMRAQEVNPHEELVIVDVVAEEGGAAR